MVQVNGHLIAAAWRKIPHRLVEVQANICKINQQIEKTLYVDVI